VSLVDNGLGDALLGMQAGKHIISFLRKDPLVLVAASAHSQCHEHVWNGNVIIT
jgi:hypothetical protein